MQYGRSPVNQPGFDFFTNIFEFLPHSLPPMLKETVGGADMELLERVACLVSELKAVQGELELPEEGGTLASPKLPEPKVQELKAAVDRMRLFLWAYMDSRAASKSALEHTLQTLRIQRATEMLHSLRVHGARLPDNASARDLMAEIRALADMIASPGS